MNRPAFILLSIFSLLLSTNLIPRERMPVTGLRLSENVVVISEDGMTDEQIDAELQDIIIAGALREWFDLNGPEIDLHVPPTCYTINENDEAIVTECPIEAP